MHSRKNVMNFPPIETILKFKKDAVSSQGYTVVLYVILNSFVLNVL